MSKLTVFAVFWIACGVLAYTATFTHFQKQFPVVAAERGRDDRGIALLMALLGPAGLVAITLNSGFFRHGIGRW